MKKALLTVCVMMMAACPLMAGEDGAVVKPHGGSVGVPSLTVGDFSGSVGVVAPDWVASPDAGFPIVEESPVLMEDARFSEEEQEPVPPPAPLMVNVGAGSDLAAAEADGQQHQGVGFAVERPNTASPDGQKEHLARDDSFYDSLYFPRQSAPLTPREQWVIEQVKQWQDYPVGQNPVYHPDGAVQYLFGASQPSIICALRQVTDIELQAGEIVNTLNIGDSARWQIDAAISSSEGGDVQHIIVKPLDVGIETSVVIATNRRTYHMRLKSTHEDYFPRVTFYYPETAMKKGQFIAYEKQIDKEINTLPETGEYMSDLSFDYKITGRAKFKPTRVYHNDEKTILEMPPGVKSGEAPVLLVVKREGRLFKKAETVLVNYRYQGDRIIVDSVFDKAYLMAGVGGNQERVVIERIDKPKRRARTW
jgi:P-type conjugative transfer protein TrbG